MKKKIVISTIIFSGVFLYGCGNVEVKEFEPQEKIVVEKVNSKEGQANIVYGYNPFLKEKFKGITFRDGKIILKYIVLDIDDMELNEFEVQNNGYFNEDGGYIGDILVVDNKNYVSVSQHLNQRMIDGKIKLKVKGKEKAYKIKVVEAELLKKEMSNNLETLGALEEEAELKFVKEIKDAEEIKESFKKENYYGSNIDKYSSMQEVVLNRSELEDIVWEINEEYEENFLIGSDDLVSEKEILGSTDYIFMEFLGSDTGQIIYDKKSKEYFSRVVEKYGTTKIFEHKGKLMEIDSEGNLVELALKNKKIETKKVHNKGIDFKAEKESEEWYDILYKDDEYVYVLHESKIESTLKEKNIRSVLYSYNLKNKKVNVIGDSELGTFINRYNTVDGEVLFSNEGKYNIGKLKGDKIEVILEGIGMLGREVYYGDTYIITMRDGGGVKPTEITVYKK